MCSLIACELYNPLLHGVCQKLTDDPCYLSIINIPNNHAMNVLIEYNNSDVERTLSYTSDFDDSENEIAIVDDICGTIHMYKHVYQSVNVNSGNTHHPVIRNYETMITNPNYVSLEIGKRHVVSGCEEYSLVVKKTMWIKLIQRVWKKIYKMRCEILCDRKKPRNIIYWQIYGGWKNKLPTIHGMLCNI